MMELVLQLAKWSPGLLYLAGVLFLYRENQRQQKDFQVKYDAIVDKYHEQVEEGIKILTLVNARLDK